VFTNPSLICVTTPEPEEALLLSEGAGVVAALEDEPAAPGRRRVTPCAAQREVATCVASAGLC
jgi:hypothetical protein